MVHIFKEYNYVFSGEKKFTLQLCVPPPSTGGIHQKKIWKTETKSNQILMHASMRMTK